MREIKYDKELLLKKIKEICDHELEDYGITYEIDQESIEDYSEEGEITIAVIVNFNYQNVIKRLYFCLDKNEDLLIEISYDNDNYATVEYWNSSIKYFWITLLEFPEYRHKQ